MLGSQPQRGQLGTVRSAWIPQGRSREHQPIAGASLWSGPPERSAMPAARVSLGSPCSGLLAKELERSADREAGLAFVVADLDPVFVLEQHGELD